MANDSDIRPGDGHVHEEAERKTPAGDGRVSGADGEVRAEHGARRQPPLRLPFDGRREDAGSWAYDHRVGLCVTIIAYLVFGIVFVGAKITLNGRSHQQGIIVDLQSLEALLGASGVKRLILVPDEEAYGERVRRSLAGAAEGKEVTLLTMTPHPCT